MLGIAERYDAPLGVIHRGDMQRELFHADEKVGVAIKVNHKVIKVDAKFETRFQLADGSWVEGDLVIAANDVKSHIRAQIDASHSHVGRATPTGDAAYRVIIPKGKMEHDEYAMSLLKHNIGMRWLGPGSHINLLQSRITKCTTWCSYIRKSQMSTARKANRGHA